jgi:hypothetical protein
MYGKTKATEKNGSNPAQQIAYNARRLVESGSAEKTEWPEFDLEKLLLKADRSRQTVRHWEPAEEK